MGISRAKVTYRLQSLCPPVSAASLSRIGVVWGVVVSHCGGCVWFLLGVWRSRINRAGVCDGCYHRNRVANRLLAGFDGSMSGGIVSADAEAEVLFVGRRERGKWLRAVGLGSRRRRREVMNS